MKSEFNQETFKEIAASMTDGMVDYNYYLGVAESYEDDEEKDFFVVKNVGDKGIDEKYEEMYHFVSEYIRKKCCFALSSDAKTVLVGYAAKNGVVCIDAESGNVLWNNKKIKKIVEIRFNNFDPDIIEVINNNLEITYINKENGEPLLEEQLKGIRQVLNWMRASKNGKFLIGADPVASKNKAIYTVYNTETRAVVGRFVADNQINERTFDITNNGKYAACSAYQREGVSLIEVATGEVIWSRKELTEIGSVYFDRTDANVVVCCESRNYILDIYDGQKKSTNTHKEMSINMYGKDFIHKDRNAVMIGRQKVEGMSFAILQVLGTKGRVIVKSAGKGLQCYDDINGKLLWEKENSSIYNLAYQEETNTICGTVNINGEGEIAIVSIENGMTVAQIKNEDYGYVFIDNNKTLICNTGKMFDVSNNSIKEKDDVFAFLLK